MSGLDKNRKRNQTICFRMSPEERRQLYARITASGLPKGVYMIQSSLNQSIEITVGKYESDRLSIELKKLREALKNETGSEVKTELVKDCIALLNQVIMITKKDVMP